MPAINEITGDLIQTKVKSKEYEENHEKIFGLKVKKRDDDYWAKLEAETKAKLSEQ